MPTELMRKRDAAAFLKISTRTLDRMHAVERGPARFNISQGTIVYRLSALREFLDRREAEAKAA